MPRAYGSDPSHSTSLSQPPVTECSPREAVHRQAQGLQDDPPSQEPSNRARALATIDRPAVGERLAPVLYFRRQTMVLRSV